jgi:hypothetical protein
MHNVYAYFTPATDAAMLTYAKQQLKSRLMFGNLINFFGVAWGLIPAFAPPSPDYRPAALAVESTALNL